MKLGATVAAIVAVLAITAVSVVAQDDPVKQRQNLMKTGVADNVKLAAAMVKGEVPFDAAKAEAAMKEVAAVPDKFLPLLHEGTFSDKNEDTTAKPEILTEMDDFKARMAEFVKLALAAADAAKAGPEEFKAAFGEATKSCRGCHEKFRIKR